MYCESHGSGHFLNWSRIFNSRPFHYESKVYTLWAQHLKNKSSILDKRLKVKKWQNVNQKLCLRGKILFWGLDDIRLPNHNACHLSCITFLYAQRKCHHFDFTYYCYHYPQKLCIVLQVWRPIAILRKKLTDTPFDWPLFSLAYHNTNYSWR